MIIVHSFAVAIALCILTMMCWGSHINTPKMVPHSYAFSLYYWDQAIGYLLLPLVIGLTLGSFGGAGRSLLPDLAQGSLHSYAMAILGGVVFNLGNIPSGWGGRC
jgi:glucose uptake protein